MSDIEDSTPARVRPMASWRYGRVRDGALTRLAAALARTTRPLWYLETLALSARYLQWLASADWARGSMRFRDRLALWERAVEPRLGNESTVVLEFGVADGLATHWWANRGIRFVGWHGFDTFEGLPSAWTRADVPVMTEGVFRPSDGAAPRPTAPFPYTWHKGLIEETLPAFDRPDAPLFVLVDVDLLEPTNAILEWLLTHGRVGDLVYFDEAFDPWNEGLALRRALAEGLAMRGIAHTGSSLLVELS